MPLELLEFVAPLTALIAVGTFILIGMHMRYRAKSLEHPDREALERLNEALDGLFEQTRLIRDDVTDLQERLDFHERLLTQGREKKVDTPV